MEKILFAILLLNMIGCFLFVISQWLKNKKMGVVWFFLFLPVMGWLFYFLPQWVSIFWGEPQYDRENLVKRIYIRQVEKEPILEEELNVVSIADAMAVSTDKEKRKLLLLQLKKDYFHTYKQISEAENDEDSESAHYVATAKMESYRLYQEEWINKLKEYKMDTSVIKLEEMLKVLDEFICTGLLSKQEKKVYKEKYLDWIEKNMERYPNWWNEELMTKFLRYQIDIGKLRAAEKFWDKNKERLKNETAYLNILELYYMEKNKDMFQKGIQELREDDSMQFSTEEFKKIRYWLRKDWNA